MKTAMKSLAKAMAKKPAAAENKKVAKDTGKAAAAVANKQVAKDTGKAAAKAADDTPRKKKLQEEIDALRKELLSGKKGEELLSAAAKAKGKKKKGKVVIEGPSRAWKGWSSQVANPTEEEKGDDEESSSEYADDTTPQTKQQRTVFDNALKGLPSEPGKLPQKARDAFKLLTTPKAKNAFVNSVLSKDCTYSDRVQWDDRMEKIWQTRWTSHLTKDQACGESFTEIVLRCHGDEEKAQAIIDKGKMRNECYEKNGLIFWKRGEVSKTEGHTSSRDIDQQRSITGEEYKKISDEFKNKDWCKFAFEGTRLLAIEDDKDESKRPPTEEGQQHLQDAYDCFQGTIIECRKLCRSLSKQWVQKPDTKTVNASKVVESSLELCKKMEMGQMQKLSGYLMNDLATLSDTQIKKILSENAVPFDQLVCATGELAAIEAVHNPPPPPVIKTRKKKIANADADAEDDTKAKATKVKGKAKGKN